MKIHDCKEWSGRVETMDRVKQGDTGGQGCKKLEVVRGC